MFCLFYSILTLRGWFRLLPAILLQSRMSFASKLKDFRPFYCADLFWCGFGIVPQCITSVFVVTLQYFDTLVEDGKVEYWHQRADERHGNLPRGNQELLVVRDKVGTPPGELCNVIFFPSVLWHCWLGDRKGIWPVKNWMFGLLVVMIWLELCTTYSSSSPVDTTTSTILCFNKHRLTQVHLENGRENGERDWLYLVSQV